MGLTRKQPRKDEQLTKSRANKEKSIEIRVETIGVDDPSVTIVPLSKGGDITVTIPVICSLVSDCAYVESKKDIKVRITLA